MAGNPEARPYACVTLASNHFDGMIERYQPAVPISATPGLRLSLYVLFYDRLDSNLMSRGFCVGACTTAPDKMKGYANDPLV